MVIDGAWMTKIKNLWIEEKYDLVKTEVFQYRMRNYNKLSRIEDKFLLDYRMAYLEYLYKNTEMANFYLDILKDIFKESYNRESMEYDYYRYRWLYVNNNYENLSDSEKINEMIEIYNYYKSMKREDLATTALENIANIKGNEVEILNNLEKLLLTDKMTDLILIKSIIKDCDKISHSLYIKALDVVNKYKFNIDVV